MVAFEKRRGPSAGQGMTAQEVRMIKAVLFDLDGTLLPMDQDEFTKGYFKELAKALCPVGIEPDALISAVWRGTGDMVRNDGGMTNEERFWLSFRESTGADEAKERAFHQASDGFYGEGFHQARRYTRENPLAAEAVRLAGQKGRKVALATNPLFPMVGQRTRMSWIGLDVADFALVTSYESDRYCKPNPRYYADVCARLGVAPGECLMIGNDEREDMWAATQAGMVGYLVEDCVIPWAEHPWEGERGSFRQMLEMLKTL